MRLFSLSCFRPLSSVSGLLSGRKTLPGVSAFRHASSVQFHPSLSAGPFPLPTYMGLPGTMARTDFRGFSHALRHGLQLALRSLQTSPPEAQQPSFRAAAAFTRQSPGCISSALSRILAISVRRPGALPTASFRFRLAADTLAVRLILPTARRAADLYHRAVAHGGRTTKSGGCRTNS